MHKVNHENSATELNPAGILFQDIPMYVPFNWSYGCPFQFDHSMEKAIFCLKNQDQIFQHTLYVFPRGKWQGKGE